MKYATPRRTAFSGQRTGKRFALNRSLLPTALDYYTGTCAMKLIGAGVWRSTLCPFHNDSQPSLRINTTGGGYKCMVCEAKGGDVLAFHMARHGLPFIDACKALGAWEGQA
jgi:hypothetical protein